MPLMPMPPPLEPMEAQPATSPHSFSGASSPPQAFEQKPPGQETDPKLSVKHSAPGSAQSAALVHGSPTAALPVAPPSLPGVPPASALGVPPASTPLPASAPGRRSSPHPRTSDNAR